MQEKKFTRAKIVIDALREHYGEKVGEFAKRLEVQPSTVSTWANRDSLDEDLVYRKCEGVNYDFLKTGKGSMFKDDSVVGAETQIAYSIINAIVPVYRFAGAGPPMLTDYDPVTTFHVPPKLVRDSIIFIQVRGDSMEPLIRDRAIIGVDKENREFVEGGIFACWIPYAGVLVKKIYLEGKEQIILRSINQDVPDIKLLASDLHDHLILGRVIWIAQDLPD